jgi:hypothetical protein
MRAPQEAIFGQLQTLNILILCAKLNPSLSHIGRAAILEADYLHQTILQQLDDDQQRTADPSGHIAPPWIAHTIHMQV